MAAKIQWYWNAAGGTTPDSYNLYRGTSSGAETLLASGILGTTYLDVNVIVGTTYFGYVTSVKNGIESLHSNEFSITVVNQTIVLGKPPPPSIPIFDVVAPFYFDMQAQPLPAIQTGLYDPGNAFGDNPVMLPRVANPGYSPATNINLQYTTDPAFIIGVTTMMNVARTGDIRISGLSPVTTYYVRFVTINSTGTTSGPYGTQSTIGVSFMAVENAAVLNGQQLFVEPSPGTSGAATVRLLLTQINPDEVPDKRPYSQEGIKFPTEVSEGKEYTTLKYDGTLGYLDLAYLCSTTLVRGVVSTPVNNGVFSFTGATGTIGFTYKGIVSAPATYASLAAMQTAIAAMTSVGANNVVVTGTVANPIISMVAALSTDVSVMSAQGTPLPTAVAPSTPTLTRRWTFLVDPLNPDVLQTFTVEKGIQGQTGMGEQVSSVFGTSMQFTISKAEQKITGDMVGQLTSDPFTVTTLTSTGNIPPIPVTAKQVSVYLGDNANNVARLTRTQQIELQVGDRVKPVFTLDDTAPSFSAVVEGAITAMAKITMMHNTQSQSVLTAMRANAAKWLIYEALGPAIETGFRYRFKVTMNVKVINTAKQDVDGARSAVYDLQPIYSANLGSTSGGAILVELDVPISVLG